MAAASLDILALLPSREAWACRWVAEAVAAAGGRACLVGGCVRDALLGRAPKDADVEVAGLEASALEALLRQAFRVETVGRAFGIFLLKGLEVDVALPRRESKAGTGHKAFAVEGDPWLDPASAAARRDFTINAISWDILSGEIIDPHDGRADLQAGILRHVSPAFSEDPLRVLRAMQFAARFDFQIAAETVVRCQSIEPEDLPAERLFEEWAKLMRCGIRPSRGLAFLRDCGWVQYFPELAALIDCPQDPQWHPEGDVWTHTLHCMDAFAEQRTGDDWEDLVVGFAVLCHDFGKPSTTVSDPDGRIRSPGHDITGLPPTETFLRRLSQHRELIDAVLPLVETHMRPAELYKSQASDGAIRRLARKVRIDRLIRVTQADMAGRPPLPADFPAGAWLAARAQDLQVADASPRPILLGRHLVARGWKPGPAFKPVLEAAFEAQIEGAFAEEAGALAWLDHYLQHSEMPSPPTDSHVT